MVCSCNNHAVTAAEVGWPWEGPGGQAGSTPHCRCQGMVLCPPGNSSAPLEVPGMAVTARAVCPFTAMNRIIGGRINTSA